jgi:outer membrane biogenesis lipoprotein LolB
MRYMLILLVSVILIGCNSNEPKGPCKLDDTQIQTWCEQSRQLSEHFRANHSNFRRSAERASFKRAYHARHDSLALLIQARHKELIYQKLDWTPEEVGQAAQDHLYAQDQ